MSQWFTLFACSFISNEINIWARLVVKVGPHYQIDVCPRVAMTASPVDNMVYTSNKTTASVRMALVRALTASSSVVTRDILRGLYYCWYIVKYSGLIGSRWFLGFLWYVRDGWYDLNKIFTLSDVKLNKRNLGDYTRRHFEEGVAL